ncbi:unnamed protein product, partial [Allacma fusca]
NSSSKPNQAKVDLLALKLY